jgi:hypothetical protein
MRDKSKILAVINTGQRKDEVAEQGSMQRVTYSSGSGSSGMIPVSNEYWEMRTSAAGETYLFSKYPVAIEYGMTTYVDGGDLDLPSIYKGLHIDNRTLKWVKVTDSEGNVVEQLVATGSAGASLATIAEEEQDALSLEDKLSAIKDALTGISSLSSASEIGNALQTIHDIL